MQACENEGRRTRDDGADESRVAQNVGDMIRARPQSSQRRARVEFTAQIHCRSDSMTALVSTKLDVEMT